MSREQRVEDGCFAHLAEVPRRAITLTVPALLSAAEIYCTGPGARKRAAVTAALHGPIDGRLPASALRTHPAARSTHDDAAIDLIGQAARMGVRCAIGHTHATPEQITRAVDAGAVLATHLGNATYATLRRHPNHLWTQLADDRLHAGFIADGHHLTADTFRAMLRAKGIERSHLVSAATALAGMPPGRYRTPVGGEVELSATGRLSHVGTPFLAGASRSLADGVATAITMAGLTLPAALRLATANPERFAGGRGVLRVDAPADLITFAWGPGDTTLNVRTVVAAGRTVLER